MTSQLAEVRAREARSKWDCEGFLGFTALFLFCATEVRWPGAASFAKYLSGLSVPVMGAASVRSFLEARSAADTAAALEGALAGDSATHSLGEVGSGL